MCEHYPFSLEPLPYAYDALVPVLDEETLHFHHDKHLQAYVDNLNNTLKPCPQLHQKSLENLLCGLDTLPEPLRTAVRNNAGGVYNHQLYFRLMGPCRFDGPLEKTKAKLIEAFGSYEQWKAKMKEAAVSQFGSGYAWLVCKNGRLCIEKTPNQNTPCLKTCKPVLLVDVWEHAYYLQYQNRRAEYVENWFSIINWEEVERRITCG